jgi:hypothetical protein
VSGTQAQRSALLTPARAAAVLPLEGEPYAVLLEHGSLEIGWYAPRAVDEQGPHRRDELYVVAAGSADFAVDGAEVRAVKAGDTIFVAAGCGHRFHDMSRDFGTWVFFYGPDGGEVV